MANYYEMLRIPKNANDKQVRDAFRKLARKYHPDLNKGNKKRRCLNFFGKITLAATTGPDKQPRPASSQPASILLLNFSFSTVNSALIFPKPLMLLYPKKMLFFGFYNLLSVHFFYHHCYTFLPWHLQYYLHH